MFLCDSKCDLVSGAFTANKSLLPGIGTYVTVHNNPKDGTIYVLQIIRIPQQCYKNRSIGTTVPWWWAKLMKKWHEIHFTHNALIIKALVDMNRNAE